MEELSFGARIRTLRREQSMHQNELARRAGCSASYISRIEKGEMVPTEAVVLKIAEALGADPRTLLLASRSEKAPRQASQIFNELQTIPVIGPDDDAVLRMARWVPILGAEALEAWGRSEAALPARTGQEAIFPTESDDPQAFYVVVRAEDAVTPRLRARDQLLVEPRVDLRDGMLALVRDAGVVSLRRYYRRGAGAIFVGLDAATPPIITARRESGPTALAITRVMGAP